MKKPLLILSSILVVSLLSLCILRAEQPILFFSWGMNNGKHYRNTISKKDLSRMPSWHPDEGPPPISQAKAVEIARGFLLKNHPHFSNAKISEIRLVQFLIPEYYKNKWFYCVVFMNNIPVTTKMPDNVLVVVMLDGSVNQAEEY